MARTRTQKPATPPPPSDTIPSPDVPAYPTQMDPSFIWQQLADIQREIGAHKNQNENLVRAQERILDEIKELKNTVSSEVQGVKDRINRIYWVVGACIVLVPIIIGVLNFMGFHIVRQ